MEWFTVKYRQPDGAIAEAEFEAADKSALFKLLAEKKISAVSVRLGRLSGKTASASVSRGLMRGIVAGVAVIAVASVVFVLMRPDVNPVPTPKKDGKKKVAVKEVRPAAVTNPPSAVVVEEEVPYWLVDSSQTNGFTREMMHKWRDMHAPPPGHVYKSLRKKSRWHIFDHKSENVIASLLRFTPGKASFGRMRYNGFTEDFLKSCETPIIVTADDDEYTAKLKREMIQTKIALKERIDAGESLEKILEDTKDEYRKLAQFKRSLERELRDLVSSEARTAKDVEDFEAAANKILEEKGIAPLKFSAITKERLLNIQKEDEL